MQPEVQSEATRKPLDLHSRRLFNFKLVLSPTATTLVNSPKPAVSQRQPGLPGDAQRAFEQPRALVFILLSPCFNGAVSAAAFGSPPHLKKQVVFPPALTLSRKEPKPPRPLPFAGTAPKVKGSERQLYIQYTHRNLLLWKTICFSVLQSSEGKL